MIIVPFLPAPVTGDVCLLSLATAAAATGWFTYPSSASWFGPSAVPGSLLLRKQSNWVLRYTSDLGGTQPLAELDGAESVA